jgi:3-dehydroquinate dehydratase II
VRNAMKILLLQGANMTYLGRRQPEIYGTTTAEDLDAMLLAYAKQQSFELEIFYSNIEGEAINRLYRAADEGVGGLVMNPAGFGYAGYALKDCLATLPFPYIEVHMTNIEKRDIRPITREVAKGVIFGFGIQSYFLGLDAMRSLLRLHQQ